MKDRYFAAACAWPSALLRLEQVLVAGFVFTLPLLLYTGNSEYGYTKTVYAFAVITLLLVLWGARAWGTGRLDVHLPPLTLPGLGLILAGALSLVNATSLGMGLQSLAVLTYFALFYLYLANAVEDTGTLQLYLGAILLAAFGTALYGLLQDHGLVPGKPGVTSGPAAMISSLGNPNYLAGFLSYLLLPGAWLSWQVRARWLKLLFLLCVGLSGYVMLLAGAIGPRLGLLGGLAVLVLGGTLSRLSARALRRLGVAVLVGTLLLTALWFVVPTPQDGEAGPLGGVKATLIAFWRENSGRTRSWDWWVGWEMFRDRPLLGVGLGNYKVNFLTYKARFLQTPQGAAYDFYIPRAVQAHNDYVQALAETGILGALAVLWLLVSLIVTAWRDVRRPQGRAARLALYAGAAGYLVHALVSFPAHLPASSLAFVLVLGLAHARPLRPQARRLTLQGRPLQVAVLAGALAGLTIVTLAYRDWRANVHLDLGNTYLQRGLYRLAQEEYRKSLALDFEPAEVLYRLGTVARMLGEPERAIAYLERSLRRFPVEQTYLLLGALKLQQKDYDGARAAVEQLLATLPAPDLRKEAELLRAVIAVRSGDLEDGLARLDALTAKYPDFEKLYVFLGETYLARYRQTGEPADREQALQAYRRAGQIVARKRARTEQQWQRIQERLAAGQVVPSDEVGRVRSSLDYLDQIEAEIERVLQALGS